MELFRLAAKLVLDSSDFEKGIGKAESAGKQMTQKFSAMTVAAGQIIAQYAQQAISTVTGMFKDAYNGFADYEQLIGGVETLFKNSADTVRNYAMQSYKTTGLSANEYMRTVTSFSASLMQGLKGDTEAAANIANMAVTDMADNANKMGTDMASIQNAYMGFAKQNYTMLDNLKLGYGGTAKEMIRLINDSKVLDHQIDKLDDVTFDQMIQAIHVIQGELGITGTTAEEAAGTISGSFASVKASFTDALTAIGSGDTAWIDTALSNFKTSLSTWMQNAFPAAIRTVAGLDDLAQAVADVFTGISSEDITNAMTTGLQTATGLVQAGSLLVRKVIGSMKNTLHAWSLHPEDVRDFASEVGNFFGSAINQIIANPGQLLNDIGNLGLNLAGGFIDGLFSGLFGTESVADQFDKNIQKEIKDIEQSSFRAGAILDYMQKLVDENGQAAVNTSLWAAALGELEKVMPGASEVIAQHTGNTSEALSVLKSMNDELKRTAIINAINRNLQDMLDAQVGYELAAEEAKADLGIKQQEITNKTAEITKPLGNTIDNILNELNEDYSEGFLAHYTDKNGQINTQQMDQWEQPLYRYMTWLQGMKNEIEGIDFTKSGATTDYQNIMNRYMNDYALYYKSWAEQNGYAIEGDFSGDVNKITEEIRVLTEEADGYRQQMEENLKNAEEIGNKITEYTTKMSTIYDEAATGVKQGGESIENALNGVAQGISSTTLSSGAYYNWYYGRKHATGLEWVPYDGYRAELHRGEGILTAAENADYRRGGYRGGVDYDKIGYIIGNSINDAMGRINVYLGADKVGDLTTKRISKNIRVDNQAMTRAMGG